MHLSHMAVAVIVDLLYATPRKLQSEADCALSTGISLKLLETG